MCRSTLPERNLLRTRCWTPSRHPRARPATWCDEKLPHEPSNATDAAHATSTRCCGTRMSSEGVANDAASTRSGAEWSTTKAMPSPRGMSPPGPDDSRSPRREPRSPRTKGRCAASPSPTRPARSSSDSPHRAVTPSSLPGSRVTRAQRTAGSARKVKAPRPGATSRTRPARPRHRWSMSSPARDRPRSS